MSGVVAEVDWPAEPTVLCTEPIAGGFGNMVLPTLLLGGTMVLQQAFDLYKSGKIKIK